MTPLASFIVGGFLGFMCGVALTFWGLDQRFLRETNTGIDRCLGQQERK